MTSETPDLRVQLAAALRAQEWTFAKTMAANPHEYVIQQKWQGDMPFDQAKALIHQFGVPKKWMQSTYTYFPANGYRYWSMPAYTPGTYLINRVLADANL